MNLSEAIARMEGWFAVTGEPNRSQRNNNPGNLEYDAFTREFGATGTDGRFAIFPDAAHGWNALRTLLLRNYADLTVSEAINRYAPSNENNDTTYIANVCKWCGCASDTLVKDVI